MKKLIVIVLTLLILAQSAFATTEDCKERLRWRKSDANIAWFAGGGLVGFFIGLPVGVGLSGPLAIIIMGGYAAGIATAGINSSIKHSKMIRLLEQAETFVEGRGDVIPGKMLTKLYRKVKKNNSDITLMDLAEALDKGNKDLSLCGDGDFRFFKDIKHAYRNGYVPLSLE